VKTGEGDLIKGEKKGANDKDEQTNM